MDDLYDFDGGREERRQTLQGEVLRQFAAGGLKPIPSSQLEAEIQRPTVMTDKEANEVTNIWNLKMCYRWRLYRFWVKRCQDIFGRN